MPMPTSRRVVLALAAAALIAVTGWCGSGAHAQEPKPAAPPAAKRLATVTIQDTAGNSHTVTEGRLYAEEVGLLSVSLEPAKAFAFNKGAATLRIPIHSIKEILFEGANPGEWTAVNVTDLDGQVVSGTPIAITTNEVRGQSVESTYTEVRLKMNSVQKITFDRSAGARTCSRCRRRYADLAWKFCPHDGEKLPDSGK